MTWTCDQVEERLIDYLDGLLQPSERAEYEQHVAKCGQCAPLLASVTQLVSKMHTMEQVEPPPRLVYAILDKTLGPREAVSGWQAIRNFLAGLASPKFAYGVASVMATCLILVGATGFSFNKPKLADLRPATIYRNADRQLHLGYAKSVKYVSDLRVVYEIQSRLHTDQNDLQAVPEQSLPKPVPEKNPGQTDEQKPAQPRQQNRANDVAHALEVLAAECPVFYERSLR
ncbi:MAG TPA: zf-HC2 domain-containing protein [Candidatus Acidoferrum sp.]|nr:zf-HC2 domain-containing protein [Candidatus Acidoferrum sp.]